MCHWLFSQFDVKFKQKANILGNVLRFKTVLLCSFGLILVESMDTWLWNCSMNFIWEQKHLGFQISFSKNNFSVYFFCVCSFITVKFKVKPAEAKNRLYKIQCEALRLGPVDISSMWRLLYDDDDSRNWDLDNLLLNGFSLIKWFNEFSSSILCLLLPSQHGIKLTYK